MLGISTENIIKHIKGEIQPPTYDSEQAVTLEYNQTDPLVIRDGIDRVTVVSKSDDEYLVDYSGYMVGVLRVTRDGVTELGKSLLGNQDGVPNWLLHSPTNIETLPWWIPDSSTGPPTFSCQHCSSETSASEIVTPSRVTEKTTNRFCRECWDEIRDQWEPEDGLNSHEP